MTNPEIGIQCRMKTFTKSFLLKITGYSLIKQLKSENGKVVGTFDLEVGGHTWGIIFSPYGRGH